MVIGTFARALTLRSFVAAVVAFALALAACTGTGGEPAGSPLTYTAVGWATTLPP